MNGDGYVNGLDTAITAIQFGLVVHAPSDFDANFSVDASDLNAMFNHWGQSVTAGTNGDANHDGTVGSSDLSIFNRNILYPDVSTYPTSLPTYALGDFNTDGLISVADLSILAGHFNQSVTPFTNGDLTGDGLVDGLDLSGWTTLRNWTLSAAFADVDLDEDGHVGPQDALVILSHWHSGISGISNGDLNADSYIDQSDLDILLRYWGFNKFAELGQVAVPEPSSAVTLIIVAVTCATIRRRQIGR